MSTIYLFPDENNNTLLNPWAGVDFLKELKSDDNPTKSIPVVMVTVRGELEIEEECLKSGAVAYMRKMAATEEIIEVVRKQIGAPSDDSSSLYENQNWLAIVTQIGRWLRNEPGYILGSTP